MVVNMILKELGIKWQNTEKTIKKNPVRIAAVPADSN
jgi:hypothetical protein